MRAEKKTEYTYIEILRVLCAFAVIVIHVSGLNWFKLEMNDGNWIVQTFYNIGGRFSVCVFCMISGALLLRPGKSISLGDVFGKYIKRILICYVAWTVIYDILYTIMNSGDIQYFIVHLFKLPKHLWYLQMLMGLYLAMPIIKQVTADRKLTLYFIWILIIFGTICGTITGVSGFFSEMAGENFVYSAWTAFLGDIGQLNMAFVPGYLGLFMLGHYINEYGLGKWSRTIVYLTIPALILSSVLTIIFCLASGSKVYTFMLESNPLVVLASAGIFEFFKGEKGNEKVYDKESGLVKCILFIGANSFGIYLAHLAVLDILDHYFSFNVASFPAIISVPIESLLALLAALIITLILKKIPVLRSIVE